MRPIDADALLASLSASYKELRKLCDSMKDGDVAKEIYQGELITFLEAILRTNEAPTLDFVPRQRWISVKDRLPEEREDVVIVIRLDWWRGENVEWMQAGLGLVEGSVTHWMPLPEAPKEE